MNIYGMLQAFARDLSAGSERQEALDLIDQLERQSAFGTIARITHGSHRWTRQSNQTDECGLCSKPRSEHDQ